MLPIQQTATINSMYKKKLMNICLLLLITAALGACATYTQSPENSASTDDEATNKPQSTNNELPIEAEETEYGNFTKDQLYTAIISELGAQRGDLSEAGDSYFDLARQTRDLGIIQRAVQFASVNNDINTMLELGLLWIEIEPSNPQPHLMVGFQFLENGSLDQAISHMGRVIELGGDIDFSVIAAQTGSMNTQDRGLLIQSLRQLSKDFPNQPSIRIALAQMLAQSTLYTESLIEVRALIDITDTNPTLVLLQAQILQAMDRGEEALDTLSEGISRFSDDRELRMNYARYLIQNDEFGNAADQFRQLMEEDPQDWETLYSIALLELEMENFDSAVEIFTRLIAVDQLADESQFYLAYVHEQQGNLAKAVEHYRQVRPGTNNFLASQQQATRISIQMGELEDAHDWISRISRGQPRLEILLTTVESSLLIQAEYGDKALTLLDNSLNKFPNETDLLFARVLYYDSITNQAGSEKDLQQIIIMKPDDSRALNHLGYMLAAQTTRYEEALELLERAIAISPNDPAIIDSLAWAQYKLGHYEDALQNLRRAFAAFPDPELASHLGEVLWVMGRHDEAIQVWNDALKESPDSELVLEAMERLQSARRSS
jgi:tetratricopeptide (TPR) repeat protein